MKTRNKILLWAGALCLIALAVLAANPSFTDFNANQFSSAAGSGGNPSFVNIKSGVNLTNTATYGGASLNFALAASGAALEIPMIPNSAAGGTMVKIADGIGALTNDGSGHFGYFQYTSGGGGGGGSTTSAVLVATNILGIHDSICIPASAFYSFNLLTPSTNATFLQVTNLCQGWAFTDGITNEVRGRFALPYDWDGGTVQMQLNALCTGTNNQATANQTNVVFAVAAAALAGQVDLSSPTFGTAIWVTNRVNAAAFVEGVAYTQPITVGNSPSASKSILWQIQRLGAQSGDTLTNSSLVLTEVRIFYTRNLTTTNAPTASP